MEYEHTNEPVISDVDLVLFKRCHFVHCVFRPRNAWLTRESSPDFTEYLESWEAQGEKFFGDSEKFEVVEGGWDHEHCDVCMVRIEDGDTYWTNDGGDQVDLCEVCYLRVQVMLRNFQEGSS